MKFTRLFSRTGLILLLTLLCAATLLIDREFTQSAGRILLVNGARFTMTNAPVLVGDMYQLPIDFSAPHQFYRIGPPLGVLGLPAVKTR